MNDRLLSLLGICRRAGKMAIGFDPAVDSIETDKTKLVLAASDISDNTAKKLKAVADAHKVDFIFIKRTKDELSFSLGKTCALVAITDHGFEKKIRELILAECNEGGNSL